MYELPLDFMMTKAWSLAYSIAALIVISVVYRVIVRFMVDKGSEIGLEPHVMNAMKLVVRVVAIIIAFTTVFTMFDLPTDLFVGASALLGAALGFGSSQTINNIVAGFYVLFSQPFKVKDYVKIGDLEGQVEEISINYTSLYTPSFNLLKVPNTQVLGSRILNMTHEGYIRYTYKMSFSHDFSESQLTEEVLEPAIKEFQRDHGDGELRSPEAYLKSVNRLEKAYIIRLFIPKGNAKMLYTTEPELTKYIMRHYDKLKTSV
ncbi:MAG: mechanosensitive ion channel family protein [Candidatus Bathyarchaeota archaeon]|nr:mechanosensitive ion channel family protein [Candidatus Bathyarchaeota archaeon]